MMSGSLIYTLPKRNATFKKLRFFWGIVYLCDMVTYVSVKIVIASPSSPCDPTYAYSLHLVLEKAAANEQINEDFPTPEIF